MDHPKSDSSNSSEEWIEMDGGKREACRTESDDSVQQSRFQVAVVKDENREKNCENQQLDIPSHDANQASFGNTYSQYDTKNLRSFRYYTREALPLADHYRNILSVHGHMQRPTLEELHGTLATVNSPDLNKNIEHKKAEPISSKSGALKLGWIQGVLIRCLLNIWGVMLFLRLSWVVGQAGIVFGCSIVLLAATVTTLTTLSMSAICTNGEVKGGGAYYMISRSLGPEFGGAIGAIFSLANAVAVAMYVVGFAEPLLALFKENGITFIDGDINAIRVIGVTTTTVLLLITIVGMEWESKTQIVLLVILVTAMADFVIGSFIPPSLEQQAQGFVGYSFDVIKENLWPNFRRKDEVDHNFMSVFAIFFPAATGILAGANISGDLLNPSRAIPKGTLLAVLITTLSYLLFAIICGSTVLRDANGLVELLKNDTTASEIINCTLTREGCEYGLMNSSGVMKMVSAFGPIIYAGVFAATLSSALASLVSAPKVFQALCKDKLFPYIYWFARGYGKSNEPRRAYLLAFFISLACVAIGKLDAIAPIISNFFLAAYCLINFSCFHASTTNTPGFRPSFKYYNKWVSLLGATLCLVVMFIINWWTALITFALILFIYVYIYYRRPDVNWGSSTQAESYARALKAIIKMNDVADHVKTYRPQLLVLSGRPSTRAALLDFANCITKKISLMVCGHIEPKALSHRARDQYIFEANNFFLKRKIAAFYDLKTDKSFAEGAKSLMELTGIGKLRPNIVLMGYKSNWRDCPPEEVLEYFKAIHCAFDMHMSVCILRLQEGFDFTEFAEDITEMLTETRLKSRSEADINQENNCDKNLHRQISCAQISGEGSSCGVSPPSTPILIRSNAIGESTFTLGSEYNSPEKDIKTSSEDVEKSYEKRDIPKDIISNVNRFQRKQKKGTIDVWWLYDDGGLTMLIPYILTTRSQWSGCKLRVFTLANRKDELDREKRNMASLLSKFRIDFSHVIVIPDIVKPPKEESVKDFENLISNYKVKEDCNSGSGNNEMIIRESDLIALKDKNRRHIRLRELLKQHSMDASLIVMTLTVPRRGSCTAPLFMAWLETLTKGMPPFLLVRGNQSSVLTRRLKISF
ncbi:solute carrier family 12 member 3-like protein [Dinothrombium tinctorium]|uniref:Solute carrier family 12 member 3-like protein n=1 Tax=Dinothrombium tinctorium TaxID=1965070 RepID=A0A443RID8_9ACAR|nr:solute carrier family 12 member 3-like protein [Dinothrombium tinctorium]